MTRTRKILFWIVTGLILLLAGLVLVIAFFDWNRVKPIINDKVSQELHRPFAINGDLSVAWQREPDEGGWRAWIPWPHVVAQDLSLGNLTGPRPRRWSASSGLNCESRPWHCWCSR